MTLDRRGVGLPHVVEALVADAGQEYLRAVLPPLTGEGTARGVVVRSDSPGR